MNSRATDILTEDKFWKIIESSLEMDNNFYSSLDEQQELLASELRKLTIAEIIAFHFIFDDLKNKAYKQDLWASAYIFLDVCHDEAFTAFRNWIITRGQKVFYNALENGDSLNSEFKKMQQHNILSWEEISYLPIEIIEEFGKDADEEAEKYNLEFTEKPEIIFKWEENNEESIKTICPNTYNEWRKIYRLPEKTIDKSEENKNMDIKSYRVINEEEKEEIDRLASNALAILNIDQKEKNSSLLKKMNEFVKNFNSNDSAEIEKYAYELGSLFGNIIREEHEWEWYYINKNDEMYYCITSSKNKACCICHNYFYSILTKERSNNFVLLFNMIEKNYPKDWNFMFLS